MNGPGSAFQRTCRYQMSQQGVLQMHGSKPPSSATTSSRAISIRIARDPNDLMLVTAIRAAVYLAEQNCPLEEEFDGNDLVAAHFIGFVGSEPAACLRVRFFGEFAKVERLAVRHQFRRSRVSFKLVQASFSATTARSPFPISPTPRWFLKSSRAPTPLPSIAILM